MKTEGQAPRRGNLTKPSWMGGLSHATGWDMPTQRVDGIDVYYETHGTGSPLVMIPGFGSSSETWSPFWNRLAEAHEVVLVDPRGSGRTTSPDLPYTVRDMAGDVAGLMVALGLPEAHVLGASMGAMIAQEVAIARPELVRSLVLCMGTCGGPNSIPVPADVLRRLRAAVAPPPGTPREDSLHAWFGLLYSPEFLELHELQLREESLAVKHPATGVGFRRQGEAISTFDSFDRLPGLHMPTLVLAGEEDVLIDPRNSHILAQRIPGARLRVFPHSGHAFTREKEAEVVAEIREFLEEVDSGQMAVSTPLLVE